ncbi:MAG: hypothetical protein ACLUN0_11315 [Roseburia sp.]
MGRDVKKLQMYSKACGIHIIAATGFLFGRISYTESKRV